LIAYRAAWVVPIGRPPIQGGVVGVDRGMIATVGDRPSGPVEDLGDVALLPGLVNAHTHLELSWMRGRVPPSGSMPDWASALIALRQTSPIDPADPIAEAIAEMRASGTCLVGDITNTLASCAPLAASRLSGVVFHELIGFSARDPDGLVSRALDQASALPPAERLRMALAPHAPYSVSPPLFQSIARRAAGRPISVHLGESPDEVEFLRAGTGAWRGVLERLGAFNDAWVPPACSPVAYLDRLGLINRNLLAVHGVQLTDAELARLAVADATLVTCPRSNQWTGAGVPPIARFYASGVRIAVGTDSLASVGDVNLFAELAEIRRLAPAVAPRAILQSATRSGADALGFGAELGSLEAGKRAEIIAVRIPSGLQDVEEYLVSGIQPFDVRWLDAG
jgi:cytosine/adenosine deaminase-related metal-dependent hydrolase